MLIEPDEDELRIYELLEAISPGLRSAILQTVFVNACMAHAGEDEADRYYRSWGDRLPPVQPTPEDLTRAFLKRCMPPLPGLCSDDADFQQAYADHAVPKLVEHSVRVVLGSCAFDDPHATTWATDLCECASIVKPAFMITFSDDPDEAFIDGETVKHFIGLWRDNFFQALLHSKPSSRIS